MSENYFNKLNAINVNDKTEKKGKLTYLSWAWAWGEVKKLFPDATFTIYENKDGWNYHTDGRTAWVKTGVTVYGIEYIEYLPVMDAYNKSIPLEKVTSFDVNKTIQRSLTKACARHGLGLYIYAGEDLPEGEEKPEPEKKEEPTAPAKVPKPAAKEEKTDDPILTCENCKNMIKPFIDSSGRTITPTRIARKSMDKFGKVLCVDCAAEAANAS